MVGLDATSQIKDLIKEKIDLNQTLESGDIVYVSYYIDFDFRSIKYKIDEYLSSKNINVKFTVNIKEANTLLIAVKDVNAFSLNVDRMDLIQVNNYFIREFGENNPYSEAVHAIACDFKIIDKDNLFNLVHSELSIVDKEAFDTLNEMLKSNDTETISLAIEIISNANRVDNSSYCYLVELYETHSFRLLSTNNIAAFEFVTSISNDERYEKYIKEKYVNKKGETNIVFSKEYTVDMFNKIKDITADIVRP